MPNSTAGNPFPDLETARLIMRGMAPSDREFVFRQFSDPAVCEFMYDCAPYTSIEEADGLIEFYNQPLPRRQHRWMLIRKDDGAIIGTCGYHNWNRDNNSAEIGYDLCPPYQGHGYVAEALEAMIDVGFEQMGLNRIYAVIFTGNRKSWLTVERAGFRREGIIRDQLLYNGKYYDHFSYSLLKRDRPGPEFVHLDFDLLTDGEIDLWLDQKAPYRPQRKWVPAYIYHVALHGSREPIGTIDLRVGHNSGTYYGGNIGYGIKEAHRGHGYAAKACRLLLPVARAHGMDRVIITCNPDNLPSRRTAENAGAKLLEIVDLPPHNQMYKEGERQKCRYELVL